VFWSLDYTEDVDDQVLDQGPGRDELDYGGLDTGSSDNLEGKHQIRGGVQASVDLVSVWEVN
jgi:hypothetical protein